MDSLISALTFLQAAGSDSNSLLMTGVTFGLVILIFYFLIIRPQNKKQKDLDNLGIAKTAREEKIRARDGKLKIAQDAENARMMALYKQHILQEPETGLVQIGGIGAAPAKTEETSAAHGD